MVPGESILSPNDALRVIVLGRKRILFFLLKQEHSESANCARAGAVALSPYGD